MVQSSHIGSATYNHHETITTATKPNMSGTTTLPINGYINASPVEGTTLR